MKNFLLLLLLMLMSTPITLVGAQSSESHFTPSSVPLNYQTETICLRFSTYTLHNQVYPIGIFGGGLKPALISSPDAMKYFKKYQNQRKWSLVCSALQIVTEVIAFSTSRSHRTPYHLAGGSISIVAIPLFIGSTNNLNKAVWIRNGELMTQNEFIYSKK